MIDCLAENFKMTFLAMLQIIVALQLILRWS
jgi:hypothetical protein